MHERGLSARALSERTASRHLINRNRLGQLLAGTVSPTLDELSSLADVFEVPLSTFLPPMVDGEAAWEEVGLALGLSMRDALELRNQGRAAFGPRDATRSELVEIWLRSRGLAPDRVGD
jgi:transcriptional regulator with XRE-family HTH domain